MQGRKEEGTSRRGSGLRLMGTTVSVRQEREARSSFAGSSNYRDKHRLCWEAQEAEAAVPPALGGEVPSKDWLFVRGGLFLLSAAYPSGYFPINKTAWGRKGAGREAHFRPFGFLFNLKDRMATVESDLIKKDGVTELQTLVGSQVQGGSQTYPRSPSLTAGPVSCCPATPPSLPGLLSSLTYFSQDN